MIESESLHKHITKSYKSNYKERKPYPLYFFGVLAHFHSALWQSFNPYFK